MKNIIKQFNACLAFMAFSFFLLVAACSSDDEQVEPVVKIPDTVLNSGMTFAGTEGVQTLSIQTNVALEVTSDKEWCTVTYKNTTAHGTASYEVKLDANPDATERTASITVQVNDTKIGTINVVQEVATSEPDPDPEPEPGPLPDIGMNSDAKTLAAKMYAGINIGNTLEVPKGQDWGNNATVSSAYIKGLKKLGFNAVRIPCAWSSHADASTYQIDAEWLDKVAEAVNLCAVNDMYAIVNIHWDGGWLEDNILAGYSEAINTKQKTLWTQIATKFKDYDEHLLFAGCNEPGMNETSGGKFKAASVQTIMRYEQTFVDAVRATGGNNATRCLIVQGPATRISDTCSDEYGYSMPTDNVANRLMLEVHFYDPYNFCLMEKDEGWGNTFWYWGEPNHVSGSEHNPTWGEEAYVKEQFQLVKTHFVDKGYPVIIGEYSAMKRTVSESQEKHNQSRAYWNEVITREAKNHGIVPFYWETNGDINRSTGEAREAYAIDGIMKGAAAGKYPY